jgi:prepilin-type processing-associated H-X9-DG protein
MMRTTAIVTSICVLVFVLSVQAAPPLAERVPAGALIYVGWSGKTDAMSASAFGKLLDDPMFTQALDGAKTAIMNGMPRGAPQQMFANAWSMAGVAWNHPCAIALVGIEPAGDDRLPTAMLVVDLGNDRQRFAGHLDALLATMNEGGKELPERQVGDVRYKVMQIMENRELAMGYMGNVFFACFGGLEMPKQILTLAAEKSLKADKQFADALNAVSAEGSQCVLYENVAGILSAWDAKPGQDAGAESRPANKSAEARKMLGAMGLGEMKVFAAATRFVENGVYTKAKLFTPAPHRGLLKLYAGKPLADDDVAAVPADADGFCAANFSAAEIFEELKRFIRTVAPEDLSLDERIADLEKKLGVSLEKDIFASLGDTWVVSSAESQGGFITGTLLTVKVKDAERLQAAIAKVEDFLKKQLSQDEQQAESLPKLTFWTCSMHPQVRMEQAGKCPICEMDLVPSEMQVPGMGRGRQRGKRFDIKAMKVGKTEIRYVSAAADDFPLPVAPAWAIHEGKLYVALWPQVIVAAIEDPPAGAAKKQPKAGSEGRLIDTAVFREARAKLGKSPSIIAYVNTGRLVKRLYPLMLAGGTMGANALQSELAIPGAQAWLPSLPRISKYLGPYVAAISSDDEGIVYEEFGSMPLQGLAGPGSAPMFLGGMMVGLTQARSMARVAVSASNLNVIGKGCVIYAGDHNDTLPPDLAAIVKSGYIPAKILRNLASDRLPPRLVNGELVGESDYVYVRGLDSNAPAELVLAYEKPEFARRGRINVLFVDTHVETMSMQDFQKALDRTQEYVKKKE